MADGQQFEDRRIEIHRDVINSAIVSGDNNKVVIYHYHLDQQVQVNGKSSLPKLGANPYRGLAAFQVEDADVYFGREKEVDRLWKRLWNLYEQSQHDKLLPRLLPILGPSGSGKSSLARAGLLPELARRPLPGHQQTRVLIVKPGETPLEKLALILARMATGDPSPISKMGEFKEVLEKRHEQGANDGLSFIASMLPHQDYPLVVLVDQFEEIYSPDTNSKQRAAFVETLLEAAVTRKAQVSVVITLRSDFLRETQQHPKLNQVIGSDQSVFLPVMTSDELRLAIEKPAEQAGHPLNFATVDQLVEQTEKRDGALPLLQFALQRIWKELSDSNFSKSSKDILREIGGVGGALSGEAERIYTSLNRQEQNIARQIFIGLAQIGEGARYTRHRVKVVNLLTKQDRQEQVQKILDRFSSYSVRLITLSSIDGEEVAEVTHEALFEQWQQLKDWMDGQRDYIRQQQRINALAEDWSKQGQSQGYLLQGRQLDDAKDFHKQYADKLPLSGLALDLIRRSLIRRRVNRLIVASLAVIPLMVVEGFLREEAVKRDYAMLRGSDVAKKPQAVLALSAGCLAMQEWPELLYPVGERLFGNCRLLQTLNLEKVNLSSADLRGVNLGGTNLSGADLSGTNLGGTSFNDTNLMGASLVNAYLIGGASLRGADLRAAFLGGADFSGADLSGAAFNYADLSGAFLDGADLSGANLSDTLLKGASFGDTDLSFASLKGADLGTSKEEILALLGQAKLCQTALPDGTDLDRNRDCKELSIRTEP